MTEIPGVVDAEETPYILCEDLFKIYKIANLEVVALRGLDLKVRSGERNTRLNARLFFPSGRPVPS